MPGSITTSQAAEKLGKDRTTISRHCKEHDIGVLVTPRMRMLTKADVAKLKKICDEAELRMKSQLKGWKGG